MSTRYRLGMVLAMSSLDLSSILRAEGDGLILRVKVVPGASRTRLVGLLGSDRLKIAVAAAPEGGRANQAACELLAETLGVPARVVQIIEGRTRPLKSVHITGISLCAAMERLTRLLQGGQP